MESLTFNPIGVIHSPYKEKFGVPRQPGLAPSIISRLQLLPSYCDPFIVDGLEQYSHLWVIFHFNQVAGQGWKPRVRPPRLGGNRQMGLFATRTMFRPNPIGLSVAEIEAIEQKNGEISIFLRGLDLVDQTPVLDIKPYIPYVDAIAEATAGEFASTPTIKGSVRFSEEAECGIERELAKMPYLRRQIEEVLQQDPRPAYRRDESERRVYGLTLHHLNIRWCADDAGFRVESISRSETLPEKED